MALDQVTTGRFANSKRLLRRLLAVLENRFELLIVEVHEERSRLMQAVLLLLGVAAFGLLTGVAFTGLVLVLFWAISPIAALLTLTAAYGASAAVLYWRFAVLLRDWQNL